MNKARANVWVPRQALCERSHALNGALDKWVAQSKQGRGRGDKENVWNIQEVHARAKQDEDHPQKCQESMSTCDA